MGKKDESIYKSFKQNLDQTKGQSIAQPSATQEPVVEQPRVEQVEGVPIPQPEREAPKDIPVVDEVKGNGHKDNSAIQATVVVKPDDKLVERQREQEETRRRMEDKVKTDQIPGNGYLFNREKQHKLETANINELQLHSVVCSKIQDTVMKEEWNPYADSVKGMYVDLMLEGSIAVGGLAREQFKAIMQFKHEESANAAKGGLFDSGPAR